MEKAAETLYTVHSSRSTASANKSRSSVGRVGKLVVPAKCLASLFVVRLLRAEPLGGGSGVCIDSAGDRSTCLGLCQTCRKSSMRPDDIHRAHSGRAWDWGIWDQPEPGSQARQVPWPPAWRARAERPGGCHNVGNATQATAQATDRVLESVRRQEQACHWCAEMQARRPAVMGWAARVTHLWGGCVSVDLCATRTLKVIGDMEHTVRLTLAQKDGSLGVLCTLGT